MEIIIWTIIAFIFAIVGIIGTLSPIIPGPFISYLGLVTIFFASPGKITLTTLIVCGILMIVASLVDNFMSPLLTKRFGGSKKATTGSFIGLIVGSFFFPPLGMILGAFFGALLGEYMTSRQISNRELRVAWGSFLGFILSTGLKLTYCISILIYLIFQI